MKKSEALKKIEEEEKEIIAEHKPKLGTRDYHQIQYKDKLFDRTMLVTLEFTIKSKKIYRVTLFITAWKFKNEIKRSLENKYGEFKKFSENKFFDRYEIKDKKHSLIFDEPKIYTTKKRNIMIAYISKKYNDINYDEYIELMEGEEDKI